MELLFFLLGLAMGVGFCALFVVLTTPSRAADDAEPTWMTRRERLAAARERDAARGHDADGPVNFDGALAAPRDRRFLLGLVDELAAALRIIARPMEVAGECIWCMTDQGHAADPACPVTIASHALADLGPDA